MARQGRGVDKATEADTLMDEWPAWVVNLARRVLSLEEDGRYEIILTKTGSRQDVTVRRLGKVEVL